MKCERCGEEIGRCYIITKDEETRKEYKLCYQCDSYMKRRISETIEKYMKTQEKRRWVY